MQRKGDNFFITDCSVCSQEILALEADWMLASGVVLPDEIIKEVDSRIESQYQ